MVAGTKLMNDDDTSPPPPSCSIPHSPPFLTTPYSRAWAHPGRADWVWVVVALEGAGYVPARLPTSEPLGISIGAGMRSAGGDFRIRRRRWWGGRRDDQAAQLDAFAHRLVAALRAADERRAREALEWAEWTNPREGTARGATRW